MTSQELVECAHCKKKYPRESLLHCKECDKSYCINCVQQEKAGSVFAGYQHNTLYCPKKHMLSVGWN